MPPKIFNLGKKQNITPESSKKDEVKFKFEIPKNLDLLSNKNDILNVENLQPDITRVQRQLLSEKAREIDNKLPRLIIENVVFNILSSEKINDLAIVNVSTKISRNEDIGELLANLSYTHLSKKKGVPGCRENEDAEGGTYAGEKQLNPSQSVTSYTEMGTVENYKRCTTCFRTNVDCPGHIGEIKLHTHFVHPFFRDYVIKILTCVCNSCSTLLLKKSYLENQGIKKGMGKGNLNKIFDILSKSSGKAISACPKREINGCYTNPKYFTSSKKGTEKYQIEYFSGSGKNERLIKDIKKIKEILNNISKEDAEWMGFSQGSHPRDMIMESIPVIPPGARPYTVREGEIKEDHITTVYDEIIRDNYKYSVITDENRKKNIEKDLYFHISHLFDNSDKKYCRSPTEKISGIKQRITKKEGLIRSNIMGKRVNFCGRSLIGPDSTIRFGEVSVPAAMAEKLTVPEMVHERNYEYIMNLWNKRRVSHLTLSADSGRQRISENSYSLMTADGVPLKPQIGSIVERYIQDGDVVLVNRQPTLYKYSMIGNTIRINNRKNIGIHMTETKMRNADFDGDEINIHVMQGVEARVEALTFANVQANIPSALNNGAMIGMMQNSLSGAYILTRDTVANIDEITKGYLNGDIPQIDYEMYKEIILTQQEYDEGLSLITYRDDLDTLPARLKKHNINPLSGKALFSALLPKDMYYASGDNKLIIKDGVLIKGQISADHIGNKGKAIHMSIWKWYGKNRAVAFVTDCTFITDWFIYIHGLTIGYGDVKLPKEIVKKIDDIIIKGINTVKLNISTLPPITSESSEIDKVFREKGVLGFLNEFKNDISKIGLNALTPINPLNIMKDSGAKGNNGNTANIVGIKGQNFVGGGRPTPKLSGGRRCLPFFAFGSEDIKARGFLSNSFITGMTPTEMYFEAEAAREGQLGTATGTAESGALYHKLVKVLEDCKVSYDGSIRNANNVIFQFSYLDGYEPGESVNTSSPSTGNLVSFINIKEAVEKINVEFSD
jgi:DNA-directed RNA polymerase beta' subunit